MKVIKISASWCMSCIIMNETMKNVESKHKLNYTTIKLDYDIDKEEIDKYNIGKLLPVYIKIDNNDKEIDRLSGEHSEKELTEFLSNGGFIDE